MKLCTLLIVSQRAVLAITVSASSWSEATKQKWFSSDIAKWNPYNKQTIALAVWRSVTARDRRSFPVALRAHGKLPFAPSDYDTRGASIERRGATERIQRGWQARNDQQDRHISLSILQRGLLGARILIRRYCFIWNYSFVQVLAV